MGQFESLINTGRKGNKEHLGDAICSPLLQKHSTTGLFLIKRKVTPDAQGNARRDLRDAVGTAHRQAEFRSNTAVSSFTAAPRCSRPGLLPLQLALVLQTTTERDDNHFKFHIQTAESTEIKCCVLHSSEVLSLLLLL